MKPFTLVRVAADGACLFNSVATGILLAQNPDNDKVKSKDVTALSRRLRAEVVDRMERLAARNATYRMQLAVTHENMSNNNDSNNNNNSNVSNSAARYLRRMRMQKTWGGHMETVMLHKILRTKYKRYFPGGLVVHAFDANSNDPKNTVILGEMTGVSSVINKSEMSNYMHIVLHDAFETGGTHFDLLRYSLNVSMIRK